MKRSLLFNSVILAVIMLVWSGCASTKKLTAAYVGKWNYDLDTPQGNIKGYMDVKNDGKVFTAPFNSDMGSVDLNNLVIKDGKLTATFDIQGNTLDVSGSFNGDVFDGKIGGGGFDMPFKASREKK
jgi:hypothetical protein